jgi:hypothetical protein
MSTSAKGQMLPYSRYSEQVRLPLNLGRLGTIKRTAEKGQELPMRAVLFETR